jgi:aldehyde dehydrogenase (NAD+)
VLPEDGATFEDVNPATAEKLVDVSAAGPKDVDKAVAAARFVLILDLSPAILIAYQVSCVCRAAFKTTWGRNSLPNERAALLNKLADLIERDAQFLGMLVLCDSHEPFCILNNQRCIGELESLDSGKGVRIAR